MKIIFRYIQQHTLEIVGLLIISCSIWFFAVSPRGELLTQQFFDGIRTTGSRSEVVIVGIDDTSLQALGAWPWNRNVFAELTKKVSDAGARAVVYDVLFLEPRIGDDAFKNQLLHTQTPIILSSKKEKGTYLSSFLIPSTSTTVFSALSNVTPDIDGKVRAYPTPTQENGQCVYGLGEKVFMLMTFKKEGVCGRTSHVHFRYPTSITTYSLVDVLTGVVDAKKIQGKIIFIGSTSLDLEDHFVGMSGEKIPGVEVHASILISLLNKEGDIVLSTLQILLTIIFFIGLTLLLLHYVKSLLGQTSIIVVVSLLVILVAYVGFSYHIIMPAPWLMLSVIASGGYSTLIRFIKERKRSEHISTLFSKYVHKDVLHELMKSPEKLNLTGEKRYLTVLFSDLRGFTTLSESLSPEDLTKILNGYFSAMTPSVLEEHGTIDKFIGDAIMAFWNAPLTVTHHEQHAVLAAIRMQEALTVFNEKNNTTLAVGVGVHAGYAVVGNVGSQERVNYTVLGDTVNLASRVEGLTKKYGVGILATEEVKNKVHDANILFRKLDVITVKGKVLPTVLYEVMRMDTSKVDIVKAYEHAFIAYQQGEFEKAKILFKDLSDKGDVPSGKMYERIIDMKVEGAWDGVWHFDEK